MTECCNEACINLGTTFIESIIIQILTVAYPDVFQRSEIFIRLSAAINTFRCKLPQEITTQIVNISTNNVSAINKAYIVIIFVTLFLLVVLNYIAILYQSSNVIFICIILSMFVLVAGVLLMYFWVRSIYTGSANELTVLLDNMLNAGKDSLCCAGLCCPCTSC
jgi:hypothetical protein